MAEISFEELENHIKKYARLARNQAFPIKVFPYDPPGLHWKGGVEVPVEWMPVCFNLVKKHPKVVDPMLLAFANYLKEEDRLAFANFVYACFELLKFEAKSKYLLLLYLLLGQDDVLSEVERLCLYFANNKRHQMAIYIQAIVADYASPKAMLFINELALVYPSKKIGQQSLLFLSKYAVEKNIPLSTVQEELISDFGFEDGITKPIQVGNETWRLGLSLSFKWLYISPLGVVQTKMPPKLDKAIKPALKSDLKRIKSVQKFIGQLLGKAMISQRRWTLDEWRERFFKNPIFANFAQNIVWGHFEGDTLNQVFIADESLACIDTDFEEYEFEGGSIGIVHPIHLTAEDIDVWNTFIYEAELNPPFDQLNKAFKELPAKYARKVRIDWYAGQQTKRNSQEIKTYLERQGWTQQAGDFGDVNFYLDIPAFNLGAFLDIGGVKGWYDASPAVMNQVLFFRISSKQEVPLSQVSPLLLSTVLADLEWIMGQ